MARARPTAATPSIRATQTNRETVARYMSRLQRRHLPRPAQIQNVSGHSCQSDHCRNQSSIRWRASDQSFTRPLQSHGLEVPYRYGSENRIYRPDFIIRVDDGHGEEDLLNLIVEIKGYRREDAKEKKSTMETYWIPGVNHLGTYGRWSFAEFTDIYEIQSDFAAKVESEFNKMIEGVTASQPVEAKV